MNTRKNFVFRSLAIEKGLNERLVRASKLDERSVSAILRRGMMMELRRIEMEHGLDSENGGIPSGEGILPAL